MNKLSKIFQPVVSTPKEAIGQNHEILSKSQKVKARPTNPTNLIQLLQNSLVLLFEPVNDRIGLNTTNHKWILHHSTTSPSFHRKVYQNCGLFYEKD